MAKMFKNTYQTGCLPLLNSIAAKPLAFWTKQVTSQNREVDGTSQQSDICCEVLVFFIFEKSLLKVTVNFYNGVSISYTRLKL